VKDRKIRRKLNFIRLDSGRGHHAPVLQVLIGSLFEKDRRFIDLAFSKLEDVRILLTW
jgi:hypothetical protein